MIMVITQNPDGQFGCLTEGGDPTLIRAALTAVRDQLDAQFPDVAKAAGEAPAPRRPSLYLPTGIGGPK